MLPPIVLQYLAAGLPVVASLEGEMANMIEEEENGHCYVPGSAEVLLGHKVRLVGDPGARQRIGRIDANLFRVRFRSEDLYRAYAKRCGAGGIHQCRIIG